MWAEAKEVKKDIIALIEELDKKSVCHKVGSYH
jgi:hypothetical protein